MTTPGLGSASDESNHRTTCPAREAASKRSTVATDFPLTTYTSAKPDQLPRSGRRKVLAPVTSLAKTAFRSMEPRDRDRRSGATRARQATRACRLILTPGVAAALASCGEARLNGEQTASPAQVLKDARAALLAARTLHFEEDITRDPADEGKILVSGDLDIPHANLTVHFFERPGGNLAFVIAGGAAFFRADSEFLDRFHVPDRYVGRWLRIPYPQDCGPLQDIVLSEIVRSFLCSGAKLLDRTWLADCVLGGELGTLRSNGTVSVDGHPAIEIVAPDRSPGSASRSIDVGLVGTAYPVRLVVTMTEGAKVSLCDFFPSTPRAQLTLSKFGDPVKVTAPSPATDCRRTC